MSRSLFAVAGFLALLAPRPLAPLHLALLNHTAKNWALYVGVAHGDFAAEGIDLQLSVARASNALTRQLIAGTVEVGHMAAGNVIEAVDAGADLAIVMAVNRPVFTLVGAPPVHDLTALRGAAIGVDNGRTGYVHLVKALLWRAGLADGDYTIRDVGGVDARDKALRAGDIQAALLSVPRDLQAIAAGYIPLAEIDQSAETYTGSVAVSRRAFIAAHPRELAGYIRGYRRAIAWLYDARNETAASQILSDNLAIPVTISRQIYRDTLVKKGWLLRDGTVKTAGLAAVAAEMRTGHPFDAAAYVDERPYLAAAGAR